MIDMVAENGVFVHPDVPFELDLPEEWVIEESARHEGIIVVRDSQPGAGGFHANAVITAAELGDRALDVESVLEGQRLMEREFVDQLAEYRLLFLGIDTFGVSEMPAAMRVASYMTGEGVPVLMHQYAVRSPAAEHSVTFTFASLDAPLLGPGVWGTAEAARWTGGR